MNKLPLRMRIKIRWALFLAFLADRWCAFVFWLSDTATALRDRLRRQR